ncbi:MAG: hypothetical protein KBD06_01445 [Candidatus Pacebacteria bacterium]|nr:hypothetical protein [Candidatus Paceibacterota bacterium]
MQQADVDAYWAKLNTPTKSIKNSLQSLAGFAGLPDSVLDPLTELIVQAHKANPTSPACSQAILKTLQTQPYALVARHHIRGAADWIVSGLRNAKHLK